MATKRHYVVDGQGRRTAVLLDLKEYDGLRQRLEDLEDALELKKAVQDEKAFRSLEEIRREEAPAKSRWKPKK